MSTNISADNLRVINEWGNDFFRLTFPHEIMNRSSNINQSEESAKLISSQLYYGERKGKLDESPYNGSGVNNSIESLTNESLWIYGDLHHPEGFAPIKEKPFHISTGKTYKCDHCKGKGVIICRSCYGKGWKKDSEGRIRECAWCSGGTNECTKCRGYGMLEAIIIVDSQYKLAKHHLEDYSGDVPKPILERSSGDVIFDEVFEYPSDLQGMLVGGIDENDYQLLQNNVKALLHEKIDSTLENYEGDITLVHRLVDEFFQKIPNPATANKVLVDEIYPVRLRVKIENVPVYQINYIYKANSYSLWIYGKEKKIYSPKSPSEFTWKLGVFLGLIIALIGVLVITGLLMLLGV